MNGDPVAPPQPARTIEALLQLMAALRTPGTGCPWDLEQNFATIAPYTIEEAYEVADAVARGDLDDLCDELGDLLLQVVFHARLAEEAGAFDFGAVVEAITGKLIRRHPHVFGDRRDLSPDEVKSLWGEIKQAERKALENRAGGQADTRPSVLDGVPAALPALSRTDKLTRKAAAVGFTWPDPVGVLSKVEEELAELKAEVERGRVEAVADELGDVLFTVANLGRYFGIDPEEALRATNRKFEGRFRSIEAALAGSGRGPAEASLEEMDRLWNEAKEAERTPKAARPPESGPGGAAPSPAPPG